MYVVEYCISIVHCIGIVYRIGYHIEYRIGIVYCIGYHIEYRIGYSIVSHRSMTRYLVDRYASPKSGPHLSEAPLGKSFYVGLVKMAVGRSLTGLINVC